MKKLTIAAGCLLLALAPWAPGATSARFAVNDTFRDCEQCPLMVVLPAGTYLMGSPPAEPDRNSDEEPRRQVTIAKPFAVAKYEVTFAEWDACRRSGGCSHNPDDYNWGRGNRPVIDVSWRDAQEYARWLSGETGNRYRLLSESEWEYAARAGTTTPFHFGTTISTDQANYNGRDVSGSYRPGELRKRTVAVGSFPENGFGLHDMHGNAHEWVADCWLDSYALAPSDGGALTIPGGCARVLRGGGWGNHPRRLRSAARAWNTPGLRNNLIGFRVARALAP